MPLSFCYNFKTYIQTKLSDYLVKYILIGVVFKFSYFIYTKGENLYTVQFFFYMFIFLFCYIF